MSAGGSLLQRLKQRAFPGLVTAFLLLAPLGARGQTTPVATPSVSPSPAAASDSDLTVSPEEEIKILDAIDAQSNSLNAQTTPSAAASVPGSAPAPATAAGGGGQAVSAPLSGSVSGAAGPVSYPPPAAPTGLSVLILKEGVYLSWDAAPAGSPVTAYDVYRSTTPGEGYLRLNTKPIPAPYFLDGTQTTLSSPQNGEDYFYVVTASDSYGKTSPDSDELAVTPDGMEIPQAESAAAAPSPTPEAEKVLAIPEKNIINLQLPADTSLSIQGYKKIEADLSFQDFYDRPVENGIAQQQDTTLVNQELVVNLLGKVGKNVDVNVDYSDVNRAGGVDQTKQVISITYHGDADSPVQEVEFGDLQLELPNTQFAGFSKNLFGLEAKLKFDNFNLTTFFAQTQGISATKTFTGNTVQVDKMIQDIQYVPNKYYLITREVLTPSNSSTGGNGALPAPNTEQIWVDQGTGQINPTGPNFGGPNNLFAHWLPGRDYTIDYSTGIITFITALPSTARIAVGFQNQNGQYRGLNAYNNSNTANFPSTVPSTSLFVPDSGAVGVPVTVSNPTLGQSGKYPGYLIKDNNNSTGWTSANAIACSPLYLVNFFNLGTDKIVPPQDDPGFLFQVISTNNTVLQTGQGVSTVGSSTPWVYNVDLDFNYLTVINANFLASTAPTSFLWPERPFANLDTSGGSSSSANPPDVYCQTVAPTSQYSVHIRYKTQSNNYSLGQLNIIQGSESVYLDGRRLTRNVDYMIDYTSGTLDFPNKSILSPDSQIVVTYEYSPFGAAGQNNILGARAEYDITDNFFIGSTFLEDDAQQPLEVPQIGSTPDSLTLFDADTRLTLSPDDVKSLTDVIPGLENWKPPLSVKLSGEVAQSYYNPDTYNANGENGVAMIDNMQGIDSATALSTNQTSWLVSAPPEPVGFLGNVTYDGGADPTNNRCRFYNANAPNSNMVVFQTIGTSNGANGLSYTNVPAYGGNVYAETQQANDAVQVLQFPYSNLTSQRWAGLRTVISTNGADFSNVTYFDSWVYNDGNPKWIMVDFGVLDEDVNGQPTAAQGSTFFSDPNEFAQPQLPADPLYAIPTFYYQGNPWSAGGSSTASVTYLLPGEETSQEGVSVGSGTSYVTENMNGTNIINDQDSYFEYGIDANWTGWHEVKIPVNLSASTGPGTTPDGISYFFNTVGAPSPTIIRSARVWMTGASPSPISGDVYFQSIDFTQNLWVLQVDPTANQSQGVTVNPSKFDVDSISQAENSSFVPTMNFVTVQAGQDQSALLYSQMALEVTYNLSSADFQPSGDINGTPIYYATRLFSQGIDLTNYQDLRFELYLRAYQPGDVLFLRVGNDPQDYYQFNMQLSQAAVSCLNTWGTVDFQLASTTNRLQVGTPFINRVTNISFGVVSPNAPSGFKGDMWIINLHAANSVVRSGLARRADGAFVIGDDAKKPFATLNLRYQEVDSGFTQMDQTSTHFQHSTQLGVDYTSSGVSLFSQPLVTQASYTHQDLTTESALLDNPYYISLPNTSSDNAIGSISYTKDLGPSFGRLTSFQLSGSVNDQNSTYPNQSYLSQPGVQGNNQNNQAVYTVASTYDAPAKLLFLPIGANQFTESYSMNYNTEDFLAPNYEGLANYNRTTRTQTYGWTNTTELVKNLVFTPGYTWTLTDAMGNTNSAGVPVSVSSYSVTYTPFQEQEQPKAGLVYRGIPGLTPSVAYTGSNSYDWVSYSTGLQFNSANNLAFTGNFTPSSWFGFLQKINPTFTYGRTYAANSTIPGYRQGMLSLDEQWGIDPDFADALLATQSETDQVTGDFKLFDVWDFRPNASWTNQLNLLSQGSNPVPQNGKTIGLTTVYNHKILTLPFVGFSVDSAQFQYTHTDSTQYDSTIPPSIANETESDLYGITLPYDLGKGAGQGNIHLQQTTGYQNGLSTLDTLVTQSDQQLSIEYDQRFNPHLDFHVPLTHWVIRMGNDVDLKTTYLMEFVNNQSSYVNNELQTQSYRVTINCQYNALTNLLVGVGLTNQYFTNLLNNQLNYVLWMGTVSAEARF